MALNRAGRDDMAYNAWLVEKKQVEKAIKDDLESQLAFRRQLWPVVKMWFLERTTSVQKESHCKRLEELFLSEDPREARVASEWLHCEAITGSGRRARPVSQDTLETLAQQAADSGKMLREYRAALETLCARQLLLAMGQGRMKEYRGTFAPAEIARIRRLAMARLSESVTNLIDDKELEAIARACQATARSATLHAMTEAERIYLAAIGDGFHSLRRLAERAGVTRQAVQKSPDFKRLISNGLVLDIPYETGLPADRLRLLHLSSAGEHLYEQITGSKPHAWLARDPGTADKVPCGSQWGFWADDLRAHALILGWQSHELEGEGRLHLGHQLMPHLLLSPDGQGPGILPVHVAMGEKPWPEALARLRQVIRAASVEFGRLDIFSESKGMASMVAGTLENILDLPAPITIRIYDLASLGRDYGRWPLEDGPIHKVFQLQADDSTR